MITITMVWIAALSAVTKPKTLNVGLLSGHENTTLSTYIGWKKTAGAVGVAWDKIQADGILPQYDTLNLTWVLSDCKESMDAGSIIEWKESGVDVVLGPACSASALISGTVAKSFNFPIVVYATTFASALLNGDYPTVMASTWSAVNQARTLIRLFDRYQWKEAAVIYYAIRSDLVPRCSLVIADFEDLAAKQENITITYRRQLMSFEPEKIRNTLNLIKEAARITIACLETVEARRKLMIAIDEAGMDTEEYLWLLIEIQRLGFGQVWKDTNPVVDGKDDLALRAAKSFFVIDSEPLNQSAQFVADVEAKMRQPPYNCTDCDSIEPSTSQVGELADAMLLYAIALNRSIAAGLSNPSGRELVKFTKGQFEGFTGTVIINNYFTRDPVFLVYGLDSSNQQIVLMRIIEQMNNSSSALIQDLQPSSMIWAYYGGSPPPSRPVCDFDGSACPPSFVQKYLAITLIAVIVPLVATVAAAGFMLRYRSKKEERLNKLWKISFITLQKRNTKSTAQSSRSLQSAITSSTRATVESKKDTQRHNFYVLGEESVATRIHLTRPALTKADCALLRKMNSTEHDHLCKFIGLSMDGPNFLSVWRYCSRGSIKDVMEKGSMQMDWFFKYSLIRDICEAICFLHHSPFGAHGWLTSRTCVVDERWQVKVTFFGLSAVKRMEVREQEDYLWVAPEHIRDPLLSPTKMGDIYSFAIVCSEIITKKMAWDLKNQDFDIDELLYKLKRGGRSPIRPSLETDEEHNSGMTVLVKDCWSEEPDQRPNCDQLKSFVKNLSDKKSSNLMDHVFNILEQYASNLEEEIQARMKELTEEKKKSDILLYRMLPKLVADKLKLGQTVEPEVFECATLFFSDVVSFTTLASRCTPLQVISFLNDLYTLFDSIIDEHDVYKVETIGDGYLCASGLPERNGNEHAREIAEMSFELLRAIKEFRIPHLPNDRVNIRVGIHTGPVVTGVVGITMPRYCLFGDTVNTASRMESNGKPGRVHISTDTMKFLAQVIGGYKTERRGEVIVKGKGAVETYWLLTPEEQEQSKE